MSEFLIVPAEIGGFYVLKLGYDCVDHTRQKSDSLCVIL